MHAILLFIKKNYFYNYEGLARSYYIDGTL